MRADRPHHRAFLVACLLLAISACAQPSSSPARSTGTVRAPEIPRTPKVLTIAIQREPPDFGFSGFTGSRNAGGAGNAEFIPHDALSVERDNGEVEAQLAVELPSIEKGTLRINADGTMDTIWQLHANVRWHDGMPFTSDDLMFSYAVFKDPSLPSSNVTARPLLLDAMAPDAHTFTMHWAGLYFRGLATQPGTIKPRHLVQQLYETDKDGFLNSPIFTSEFVGLGPYRLVRWERGSHMEFTRFDEYYRGRPPFDRVLLRFLGDANAMVANILAGEVDAVLPIGVPLEAALEVEERWRGTGHQVRADLTGRLVSLGPPHRPDSTRPTAYGFTERSVREALYRAIDRTALAEVVALGKAPAADSWISPSDAIYPEVASSIPQFPHDPARAEAILSQVGWERGRDGVLVHRASGERFATPLGATNESTRERELTIVADRWKAIGVETSIVLVASNLASGENTSKHPGPYVITPPGRTFTEAFLHSRQISTEANRWTGQNRQGYNNPRVDAVLDQLQVTIDPRERVSLHRQLLQEQMGDLALMPLYWEVVPVLMRKGVKTNRAVGANTAWGFFDWDKEA